MKLYLIQHGKALSEENDPKRPLSTEGKEETERIAQFLKSKNITVDMIWHSSKLRAIQTAQIIAKHISPKEVNERDDLNPKDPVDKLKPLIQSSEKEVMIVGHLPFLQKLCSHLLVNAENVDIISFRFSGVVCLDYQDNWKIQYMMIPEFL